MGKTAAEKNHKDQDNQDKWGLSNLITSPYGEKCDEKRKPNPRLRMERKWGEMGRNGGNVGLFFSLVERSCAREGHGEEGEDDGRVVRMGG